MSVSNVVAASLRRSFGDRGFAALFIITLALGVGANAALLAALRGYLVRPLPYQQADNLVTIGLRVPKVSAGTFPASVPIYRFLSERKHVFTKTALAKPEQATVVSDHRSHTVNAENVTSSLFPTLGISPHLGHFFSADADQPDGPAVAVISYGFWQNALNATPNAVGQTLIVNGVRRRIVAVMNMGVFFPHRDVAVYLPMRITPADAQPIRASQGAGTLVARATLDDGHNSLQPQLKDLSQEFVASLPPRLRSALDNAGFSLAVQPLRTFLYGDTAQRLGLIELGALVLLALAVVNLMNLTLVRTLRRRHEISLRLALGASRRSLLGLALSETLPLAVVSWAIALGIAYAGTLVLRRFGVGADATAFTIGIDPVIIAIGLGITLAGTGLAILPMVLAPRRALLARLVEGPRGTASRGAGRLQRALSVAQVAFAVALLVNAVLLGITLNSLSRIAPGFDPDHLVVAQLTLQGPRFAANGPAMHFDQTLRKRINSLPGVQHAALSGGGFGIPFLGTLKPSAFATGSGHSTSQELGSTPRSAYVLLANGNILNTLKLQLLHGAALDGTNIKGTNGVLVDRRFARRFFGTTNVIGKTLIRGGGNGPQVTIHGVVDHMLWGPPPTTNDVGTVIMPYTQEGAQQPVLLVRSNASLKTIKIELRGLLTRMAPDQSFTRITSMRALMGKALAPLAAPASLYGLFGLVALLLAAVGVYGVVAYRVRLRLPEFAVRQTLGATPARIVLIALAEGGWIAATGIVLGLIGGWWLHELAGHVTGTGLVNAAPYAVTAAVMAAVIVLAAFVPALRASRTNLVAVLRPQ